MRAAVSPDISDLSFIVISRMVLNRSIPLRHKDNVQVIPQKRLMPEPEFHLHRQHRAKLIHPLLKQRQHTGNKHPTKKLMSEPVLSSSSAWHQTDPHLCDTKATYRPEFLQTEGRTDHPLACDDLDSSHGCPNIERTAVQIHNQCR